MNINIVIENYFYFRDTIFYFIKFIFSHRCSIRCLLFHCKVSIFLSSHSFHPAFCHSRMPEGSSANLSWTRTSTWTVLRVLRRLIGEHEASDPPICLIFQEWKIFKCCRCCFIFYALVRVTVPLVTFLSQTRRVFDKLPVDDYHANCTRLLLCDTLFATTFVYLKLSIE